MRRTEAALLLCTPLCDLQELQAGGPPISSESARGGEKAGGKCGWNRKDEKAQGRSLGSTIIPCALFRQ